MIKALTKKRNNKGFTLVELIVVIAILAVLMAILVPQYIQYVERSRQGTDASALGEILHAVEVENALATPTNVGGATGENVTNASVTVTIATTTAKITVAGVNTSTGFIHQVSTVIPPETAITAADTSFVTAKPLQSGAAKAGTTLTIEFSPTGVASWATASQTKIDALAAGTSTAALFGA